MVSKGCNDEGDSGWAGSGGSYDFMKHDELP